MQFPVSRGCTRQASGKGFLCSFGRVLTTEGRVRSGNGTTDFFKTKIRQQRMQSTPNACRPMLMGAVTVLNQAVNHVRLPCCIAVNINRQWRSKTAISLKVD